MVRKPVITKKHRRNGWRNRSAERSTELTPKSHDEALNITTILNHLASRKEGRFLWLYVLASMDLEGLEGIF